MPTKRALIVDDSTTAQYRLKKMLRPYGLHIDVMDSGEAALRYLATNEPDVIFMDHLMPGMDGFRALQIIKSHPETATIPVIMYTSKSGDVYTGQARALGALDVVNKDTINSVDLSNVLQTIHIYRDETVAQQDPTPEALTQLNPSVENSSVSAVTADISDVDNPLADRRIPGSAGAEQARNLELRLSHLEHTLEDSRRFITARVIRELQGLRQNLKQEFSEVLAQASPHVDGLVAGEAEKNPSRNGWMIFVVLLLFSLIGLVIFYGSKFDQYVSQLQDQQVLVEEQLKNISPTIVSQLQQRVAVPAAIAPPARTAEAIVPGNAPMAKTYLADLAWTFNQTAAISFTQNNIDPKVAIRLHELLSRIIANGFKGNVLISIYVGNFCLAIDTTGQVQMPSPMALTMANCVLSSEVYGIDQVMKHYANDIEAVLAGLSPAEKDTINIVINTFVGSYSYPDRQATTSVKDWNAAAQANNRLELRLEASSSTK